MRPSRKKEAFNDSLKEALSRVGIHGSDSERRSSGLGLSAVDALIFDVLGPQSSLLGRRGRKRPSRRSQDPKEREKAAAASKANPHNRTLTQIAQMLHCEGFNEFAAFGVLYYAQKRLWGDDWRGDVEELRARMGKAAAQLEPEDRKAIGQFTHRQASAAFEAGLRIGLMASLWTLAISYERDNK